MIAIIIAIIAILVIIGMVIVGVRSNKPTRPLNVVSTRVPEIKKPNQQYKYGLYFNPVAELEQKLPSAIDNHLWEIKVVHKDGEYGLSLGLYSLAMEALVGEMVYNLSTYEDEHGTRPVAEYYTACKTVGISEAAASKDIIDQIIPPMIKWAESWLPKELPVKQLDELDYVLTAGLAKKQNVV